MNMEREVKPYGPGDTVYRQFHISIDGFGYSYSHDDYDGSPDAYDNRCGHSATMADAMESIDEWWRDQADKFGHDLTSDHDKTIAMVKSVVGID
jgi:hypothetical protein